jgi:hypothetical protein
MLDEVFGNIRAVRSRLDQQQIVAYPEQSRGSLPAVDSLEVTGEPYRVFLSFSPSCPLFRH